MAKIIPSSDPDFMQIRKGGGVFIVMGLLMMIPTLIIMGVLFAELAKSDLSSVITIILFFSVFALVDVIFIFGRAGINIERRYKTITTWWGLMSPFKSTQYPYEDYDKITIKKEIRRNKNSTYTAYVGRISGAKGDISLDENTAYLQTLQICEAVAKFMKIPLHDFSTDSEVIREPKELDETLRNNLRRKGTAHEIGEMPKNSKIKHRIQGGELILVLPKMGWGCTTLIVVGIGIIMTIIFSTIFGLIASDPEVPTPVKIILVCCGLLPGFLAFFFAWKSANIITEVRVSPQTFQIKKIGKFGQSVEEIPIAELEELRLLTKFTYNQNHTSREIEKIFGDGYSLYARSDFKIIQFGQGLSHDELKWVLAVIENTISA